MKSLLFYFTLCITLCLIANSSYAKKDDFVKIIVSKDQSVRDIARQYLKNPDLWPDILHANNLKLAHEVRPGMSLEIPVKIILKVHDLLEKLQNTIYEATREGAKIFAGQEISDAILKQNSALEFRKKGQWNQAFELVESAISKAEAALEKSMKNRNIPVQAVLDNQDGRVQNRKPSDLYWKDTSVKALLVEKEKIRTLSESFADICFRDQSHIRLNENSQIMIRQMRSDRLKNKEKSSIVLYGGDIYALLGGNKKKDEFDVKTSGVSTKINSNNFWVNRDKRTTRFANYEGKIEIASKGLTVVLEKNQGAMVKDNQKPTSPKDLLPAPELISPKNYKIIYKDGTNLKWEHIKNAYSYWVEIAKDESFKELVVNKKNINQNAFLFSIPSDNGIYYWQVSAIDAEGFPGPKSKVSFFKVLHDTKSPYIVINSPYEGQLISNNPIKISGKTESDANVIHMGKQIPISDKGEFSFDYNLKSGINNIVVQVKDPAGNITNFKRNVKYLSDEEIFVQYDLSLNQIAKNHFIINTHKFTLTGKTKPGISITIKSADASSDFSTSAIADNKGRFQISMPVNSDKQEFILIAAMATGFSTEYKFIVEKDIQAPEIHLDNIPSLFLSNADLLLKGKVKDGNFLTCNNIKIDLQANGLFEHIIKLSSGKNIINLTAKDIACNICEWKKDIILDQEAPEFLGVTLSKHYSSGGDEVFIKVKAYDQSGMKAGSKFSLLAGKYEHRGYLRLCQSKKCYNAKIILPDSAKGKIKLKNIRLEDYLGNSKDYFF